MQTVHVTAYAVRTLRGNYVKTDSGDGIGYALFNTKAEAKEWAEEQGQEDCFTTKVRIAITPIDSGRTDRLVAVQKARSKTVPETQQEFKF